MIFKLHVYTNVWSGEILSSLILGLKFKLYLTFFKISSFFQGDQYSLKVTPNI